MTCSFNLIDQKWIPCIHFDGHVEEFSLRDTFANAHELRGIQGNSPLETASLHRLLLAILHSAIRGPRNAEGWGEFWDKGKWESEVVGTYLDNWYERFDLFDPRKPFYQTIHEIKRTKLMIEIVPEISSGHNPTLFEHSTEEKARFFTPAESARALIVLQTMSLSGGSGLAPIESQDAVWGRGIVFLIVANNLFETLALNLLEYSKGDSILSSSKDDAPIWELDDPFLQERHYPNGYLDYLTWQSRKVLLLPEEGENLTRVRYLKMGKGLELNMELVRDGTLLDPMKTFLMSQTGYNTFRYEKNRALWRDFATFINLKDPGKVRPPQNLRLVSDLIAEGYLSGDKFFKVLAVGMANNQAKIEFTREEYQPLPLSYLSIPEMVESISEALKLTEIIARQVSIAIFNLARIMQKPTIADSEMEEEQTAFKIVQANNDKGRDEEAKRIGKLAKSWGIESYFWSRLESHFYQLLHDLPSQPAASMKSWQKTIFSTAREAFGQAEIYVGADRRAHRARVFAREQFDRGLNRIYRRINPINGGESNG